MKTIASDIEPSQDNSPDQGPPLEGLLVVDFTHVISGPFATQMLSDMGARVIKIESESGDIGRHIGPMVQGQSHYFLCFNRNKESIVLDLKSDEGRDAALSLIASADVVVENFAPGVMERLGLGYEAVAACNPRLIYCSISGFGHTGPLSHKRSFDLITQAYAGALSTNGDPSGPPTKIGLPIGDTTGSLFAVIAILAALNHRAQTGTGQKLDLSLFECLLATLANHGGHYFATGSQPVRTGSHHYFCVPNGVFATADGHVAIAVTNDEQWMRLARVLGFADLADDPAYATMSARNELRSEINALVEGRLSAHSTREAVELLDAAAVPCGPVNDIRHAFEEDQAVERNVTLALRHPGYGTVRAVRMPIPDSLTRQDFTAPPKLGEHSQAIRDEFLRPSAASRQKEAQGSS